MLRYVRVSYLSVPVPVSGLYAPVSGLPPAGINESRVGSFTVSRVK